MNPTLLNRIFVAGLFMLLPGLINAQTNCRFKADLGRVARTGFYSIALPPEIVARSLYQLADLRITNESFQTVPYILKAALPALKTSAFIEFPIVSVGNGVDSQSQVTLENTNRRTINNLSLTIRNADAERLISISGSDGNNNWYVIKENIPVEQNSGPDTTSFVQNLSIPASNYRFLRLSMPGKNLLPLNIISAGVYENNLLEGKWMEVPEPEIVQFDSSDKNTYVQVIFSAPFQLDKIDLDLKGARFFRRPISLFTSADGSFPIINGFIHSAVTNSFPLSVKSDRLKLVISNEDNVPLEVRGIRAYQLNQELLTYLEEGKIYQLVFGDSTASSPTYDLKFFKDSIPAKPMQLSVGYIGLNKDKRALQTMQTGTSKQIMWISIGFVLLLLLFFTFKMVNEINRKRAS